MLGVSGLMGNSGDGAAAASGEVGVAPPDTGGGFSEEDKARVEESERGPGGGNRWPRQETLALLKIRSDMDVAFKDSSLKGPLWEEVSRKLAELGYHRNAKKCKEKFENVYKYHKRTKGGRSSKPEGKTYRFFDQLQALETHNSALQNHNSLPLPPPPPPPPPPHLPQSQPQARPPMAEVPQMSTVPSQTAPTISSQININPSINPTNIPTPPPQQSQPPPPPPPQPQTATNPTNPFHSASIPPSYRNINPVNLMSSSPSSSSSTSSDEEPERRCKRKRKWEYFFERVMKEVIQKQEEMQKNFLEALEKRERDRAVREEAWRVQEMARINREHELLVQERSIAAAKDAAVMTFLQKVADQQNPNAGQMKIQTQMPVPVQEIAIPQQNPNTTQMRIQTQLPAPEPVPVPVPVPTPPPGTVHENTIQQQSPNVVQMKIQTQVPVPVSVQENPTPQQIPNVGQIKIQSQIQETPKITDNGGGGEKFSLAPSPSRWPKPEVEALIKLRTNLDMKYQENGPKGPLWEEVSSSMIKLGYNRNPKRCKEKWENINKYFKKVKESNKRRPEDSKTCPYFHQLDALYREKKQMAGFSSSSFDSGTLNAKPENSSSNVVPLMVQPEQQWPLPQQTQQLPPEAGMEDQESENHEDGDDDDNEDEEDDGGGYEVVANKPSSGVPQVE